jgi:MFS family permease
MAIKALSPEKETAFSDKGHAQPSTDKMNISQRSKDASLSAPNRFLILGCLIYFTYSLSIAVDSQFLSLYYKSKGFDGTTLGVLYSLTPLTTFLTVPVWGMLTRANGDGNRENSQNEEATCRPFQIICINIVIATTSQISLAFLDEPIYMMLAIIVASMFQSPAKPMLDGIIMDHMDDRSNFGKVRFFSILGSGFGTSLGGRLLTMVQKSTANHDENIGTGHFLDNVFKFSSGFHLLFFARFILTIPPIICIGRLQTTATMKMKTGDSTSQDCLEETKKVMDHRTSENGKEKSASVVAVARNVAKLCFGDRNYLLFFLCVYMAGASGGVSDAFSCK